MDLLARRVVSCRGPSGENSEYVYLLEEALRELAPGSQALDAHVRDLAARCRELEEDGQDGGKDPDGVVRGGEHATDALEEVEVRN
jgi:hypothetical protein